MPKCKGKVRTEFLILAGPGAIIERKAEGVQARTRVGRDDVITPGNISFASVGLAIAMGHVSPPV